MRQDKRLEEMKQDYQKISMPEELEKRVQKGIAQARGEVCIPKPFFRKPAFWVKSGGCVAAAMAALILLSNFNAPVAHAMKGVPFLGKIVDIVSFRTFEDNSGDMQARVNIPEVEVRDSDNQKNEPATKEINDQIQEYVDRIIEEYQKDVKAVNGKGKESVTVDYEIVTNSERLFSVRIDSEIAFNTSDVCVKIYHIDKETGKAVTIRDIFREDSGYQSVLTKEIKRQMRRQMKEDGEKSYYIDSKDMPEDNWKGLTEDAAFYFNDQGKLMIVFDKYEVAPGYMGSCEFQIPSDLTGDILKAEYQ